MIKMVCGWSDKRGPAERLALISSFAELFALINADDSCDTIRDRIAQAISIGMARIEHVLRDGVWSWELGLWDGTAFLPVAGIPDGGKSDHQILVKSTFLQR